MKLLSALFLPLALITATATAPAQDPAYREHSFYGDPPDDHHPWVD